MSLQLPRSQGCASNFFTLLKSLPSALAYSAYETELSFSSARGACAPTANILNSQKNQRKQTMKTLGRWDSRNATLDRAQLGSLLEEREGDAQRLDKSDALAFPAPSARSGMKAATETATNELPGEAATPSLSAEGRSEFSKVRASVSTDRPFLILCWLCLFVPVTLQAQDWSIDSFTSLFKQKV